MELQLARHELGFEGAIEKLDKFEPLILHDLAYVAQDRKDTSVLFELISACYERRSVPVTANQSFGAWDTVFPDPATPVAGRWLRRASGGSSSRSPHRYRAISIVARVPSSSSRVNVNLA